MRQQAVDVLCTEVHIVQEHHFVRFEDKHSFIIIVAAAATAEPAVAMLLTATAAAAAAATEPAVAMLHAVCDVALPVEGFQHFVTHPGEEGYAIFIVLTSDATCDSICEMCEGNGTDSQAGSCLCDRQCSGD